MDITEVASGLQFPEGPIAMDDGSVILVEIARGTLSRVSTEGEVSVIAELGGGLEDDGGFRTVLHVKAPSRGARLRRRAPG